MAACDNLLPGLQWGKHQQPATGTRNFYTTSLQDPQHKAIRLLNALPGLSTR